MNRKDERSRQNPTRISRPLEFLKTNIKKINADDAMSRIKGGFRGTWSGLDCIGLGRNCLEFEK